MNKICSKCKILKSVNEFYIRLDRKNLTYFSQCKQCYQITSSKIGWENKIKVIEMYGGKCVCCGENNPHFLTIDHINGDGNLDRRKSGGGGRGFYKTLIKNKKRNDLRLLCMNCNWSLGKYGYCPHGGLDGKQNTNRYLHIWTR